jgi:hypothetical protein
VRTAGSCGVGHARRDRHHRVGRRPHPRQHITGGRLNHFSRHPVRYSVWTGISWLNVRHMQLALMPRRSVFALEPIIGNPRYLQLVRAADQVRQVLAGRTIWNVNSTATGGGVA